jgi:hypothetical protein
LRWIRATTISAARGESHAVPLAARIAATTSSIGESFSRYPHAPATVTSHHAGNPLGGAVLVADLDLHYREHLAL